MASLPNLFLVEDDSASAALVRTLLEGTCAIDSFATAEDCLARLAAIQPRLFLLDVGLPGIDGYELCRQIKARPETAHVPVMFISGHVEIESRLRGYEVGAHDFITKPFDVREVQQKVALLLRQQQDRNGLEGRLVESDTLASLILSNLDEYAVLLNYLRDLNSCADPRELAQLTLGMLRGFRLRGVVQLRLPEGGLTVDTQGESTPIAESVISHVKTMGRIFEFRRHGVYNFDRITLMVDNMPIADPELCSRLRDHLAIAVETAEARLAGQLAVQTNDRASELVGTAAGILQKSVASFAHRAAHAHEAGSAVLRELSAEMRIAISHLGMTMLQEESILELIERKTSMLITLYDAGAETHAVLAQLQGQLAEMQTLLKENRQP